MEIRVTTEIYSHDRAEIIYVPVSRKLFVPASNRVVAEKGATKSWSFAEDVPAGYTCVNYKSAALEDVTLVTKLFCQGGPSVQIKNMSMIDDILATGANSPDAQYYYYTVRATLICVRSDLLQ